MARLLPSFVGFAVLLLGFALSSGILTVLGVFLIAAGVLWFVFVGNGTKLSRKARQ